MATPRPPSSLEAHLEPVASVNPLYAQLRDGLAALDEADDDPARSEKARQLSLNLDRARALPAAGRFVLVDAAAQRLYLYEDGAVQGSMKVIVGKPTEPTPMLASVIRRAIVNPYWNVPPDLVRKLIAPRVLKQGVSYLSEKKYEVLTDWSEDAAYVDPSTIDWNEVAAGDRSLCASASCPARQLDGTDQVRVPEQVRGLSARHSGKGPVRQGRPQFQLRLRAGRGPCQAGQLAVRRSAPRGLGRLLNSRFRCPSRCRCSSPI